MAKGKSKKLSTNHIAHLTKGAYVMGGKKDGKKKRVKDTQKAVGKTDYIVNSKYSDSGVTVYQHKNDAKNVVISHRGTAVGGKKGFTDLINDISFSAGFTPGYKKRFNQRKRTSERVIRDLKPTSLHVSGHSLGGATANHSVSKSKLIRDNLTSLNTFNAATHPVLNKELRISKTEKAKLKGKVTHHRIENDSVSLGARVRSPFGGTVKTRKNPNPPKKTKGFLKKTIGKAPVVRALKATKESIDAHSLDNFIEK